MSTAPSALTPPPTPIALRAESIAQTELALTVKNLPEPWHSLDYSVEYEGQPIFTVQGFPWSIGQRRVFYDRSGLPLFELRGRWYNSSALELRLPGEMGEVILSAKLRVAVRAPRVVVKFRNAVLSERGKRKEKGKGEGKVGDDRVECFLDGDDDVTLEVRDEDPYNNTQVLVLGSRIVAHIRRITNPAELIEGQRPPFRYRSRWEVRVAQGVDVALIAVVVVILGQRVAVDAYDSRGSRDI